ncbi:YfbK domain-containing protein [Streptomyces sp. WI04-05B]|uniref:vWA domain-containing protein n=1 Tax=Streptomyces TaxID=1883 RepID=UPI0029BC8AB6|nr:MULTISPECIES: von Willebrand factor type A domain-containing protein [unclassified Streptomyces]MDX2547163.1 von Willebrand factor type A domain-containing protein [Streptomyces sp. WI04-05B]MDX2581985.1 von Willebrand factor type A domain-containing protein [Streptomyces sp. WI04-05A]MDX3753596.1 von Willebrand factor type A domain-containing protein [Streptomyces sp. AK08-02]
MERTRIHRTRRLRGTLIALTAASGLLLTGCSGDAGDSGQSSKADSGQNSGGGSGYAPAPAQSNGSGEQRDGDRSEGEQDDAEGDFAPPPDYLSTFALDVDTASYGYARRTLADGHRPDPSTVRPEEFVNSFRQDYERPDGNGFSVTVDGARTDREDWSLVRVGLATRTAEQDGERPPAALTFVIDISGSMAEPGRLDLAKDSLGVMTDRLRDDDSVAIVTFSDEAETVLPMTRLDDHRDRVHDAIDELEPTDSTNLGAGVRTGYATAVKGLREGATNRVVLVSDALANTGDTEADSILDRISDARREHGITLFGVGVGSDYGDALMEQLADKGDGNTTYVSNESDARKVFCEQLPRNVDLTARDAKAQVAFDPETVAEFRLIGYDNRRVADDDFRDDRVDGGEVGPGHTVTALYAVRTKQSASGHLATATVRWLDPETREPHEESGQLEAKAVDEALWNAPSRLQVTAVAAYFADALRKGADDWTTLPGAPSLSELADKAHELANTTEDKAVRQLAEAIDQAGRYQD